jgi:ABC-type cobalamin/Fe3+-siderophores transport system ATPase subunit
VDPATGRELRRRIGAEKRLIVIVAGPNGAGKSTFVDTFLKPAFTRLAVNPDEVAKGLSQIRQRPSHTRPPASPKRGAAI